MPMGNVLKEKTAFFSQDIQKCAAIESFYEFSLCTTMREIRGILEEKFQVVALQRLPQENFIV